ncbi:HAMP domain-containing sensor histidine kinase [Microbacterium sp. SORGH_AS_0888]|uniref:sensor histidine kinase n=1 Tax=Microbacterium sp. SORGH_AS_0888 TaxID=3041791 RepID=UPI002784DF7D|nr:HAMP domain-containing sensor histidine kinase [Microbacterium sp. SORGH_AS_0888]MDQ1129763.1 two-component system sensor histidine kinase VanS [Microbacterium sp. SORGH_AS_0888]
MTARRAGVSIRLKLALSYAGFLIVAGGALVVVGLLVLRFVPQGALFGTDGGWAPNRMDLLEVFTRYAAWAILALVLFGLVGGWVLAGIVLRPLTRMTNTVARIRDGDLDLRVALPGRRDELTELADTLDAMLDRLARTLEEERRFAANASHELRTPHAVIRTLVEVAEADPEGRDIERTLARIGATNDRAIATTEALLALAKVGSGAPLALGRVDLSAVVTAALADVDADAAARRIRIETDLRPSPVTADGALMSRLAANLLRNAVVHNVDGGWIRVCAQEGVLTVENGGEHVSAPVAATLTEPFVRGAGRTRGGSTRPGSGLGLAIVASIVRAHSGTLTVVARAGGGLRVTIRLPR